MARARTAIAESMGDRGVHEPEPRPYAPSWIHAFHGALDALPGPMWLAAVVFGLAIGAITQVQEWQNGSLAVGTLNSQSIYWTFLAASLVYSLGAFRRLAGRAFDSFRPAFAGSDEDAARLRYELTTIPARGSAVILVISIALTLAAFVFAPEDARVLGVSIPVMALSFVAQTLAAAVLFTLGWQLIRQMRLIRIALAEARVDLFNPGPLQALSRITARTGLALVAMVTTSVLFIPVPPDTVSLLLNSAPFVVIPPVLAAVAFLLPLADMHERLVDEKAGLMNSADARLRGVLAELNHDVDETALARADGLSKLLGAMIQQRDLVTKLPTWPWSSGTFRAFLTAILLPIFLFLIQRVLAQFV